MQFLSSQKMHSKMRLRFLRLAHFLLFIIAMQMVNCQQPSATLFQAVQAGGVPQCSTDAPLLALRARSSLECSNLCVGLQGKNCAGFNFQQSQANCEIFKSAALSYSEIPGCTLFQITSITTEPPSATISSTTDDATFETTIVTTDDAASQTTIFTTDAASHITSITTEPSSPAASSTTESTTADPLINCSFPFTYMGNLYYGCIMDITHNNLKNQLACLAHNWTWIACPSWQANFTAQNVTMNITIPTLDETTPAMTVNGWIIFQQQLTQSSTPLAMSFNQNWATFAAGFGALGSNYYMGNEKVHLLTQAGTTYRLRIEMLFTAYGWMSAEYDQFSLDNETGLYQLNLAGYSNGECGNGLIQSSLLESDGYQNGMPFSTHDNANDNSPSYPRCASSYSSGFWYNNCDWVLVWGDSPAHVGWFILPSTPAPLIIQSRMMIKASG